jgi:hypothetical protein
VHNETEGGLKEMVVAYREAGEQHSATGDGYENRQSQQPGSLSCAKPGISRSRSVNYVTTKYCVLCKWWLTLESYWRRRNRTVSRRWSATQ